MTKFESIHRKRVRDVVCHQDQESETHARDHKFYRTIFCPDPWLKVLSPRLVRHDPSKGDHPVQDEFIRRLCQYAVPPDRPDRPRDELGYKIIWNPDDRVQAALYDLSKVAPDLFLDADQFMFQNFGDRLEELMPSALNQQSRHSDSGRWHAEACFAKYDSHGHRLTWAQPSPTVDKPGITASKAAAAHLTQQEEEEWGINTRLEVRLYRDFYRYYVEVLGPLLRKRKLIEKFNQAMKQSMREIKLQTIHRDQAALIETKIGTRSAQKTRERLERHSLEYEEFFGAKPDHPPIVNLRGLVLYLAERHLGGQEVAEGFWKEFKLLAKATLLERIFESFSYDEAATAEKEISSSIDYSSIMGQGLNEVTQRFCHRLRYEVMPNYKKQSSPPASDERMEEKQSASVLVSGSMNWKQAAISAFNELPFFGEVVDRLKKVKSSSTTILKSRSSNDVTGLVHQR